MMQIWTGGCACGAIRYECNADPVIMLNCHCGDCQRASGGAYAAIVIIQRRSVRMHGEPRYHKLFNKAGNAVERGFCPTCGSQLTVKSEKLPDILGLQAGSLDDPSMFQPKMDVFTSSAQPWDYMDPAVPKHTHGQPI